MGEYYGASYFQSGKTVDKTNKIGSPLGKNGRRTVYYCVDWVAPFVLSFCRSGQRRGRTGRTWLVCVFHERGLGNDGVPYWIYRDDGGCAYQFYRAVKA